ncbi:hypothetical protein DNTS_008558, partial [Danionella cerebrum]
RLFVQRQHFPAIRARLWSSILTQERSLHQPDPMQLSWLHSSILLKPAKHFQSVRWPTSRQITMQSGFNSDDYCQYDSTWDDEYENKPVKHKMYSRSRRNIYAARDMQEFRHSCKNLDRDGNGDCSYEKGSLINLKFYKGQLKSSPDNIQIDQFADFMGRYDWLEMTHSYIQWMFPLQERGMNWEAEVLTKKEIQLFREDKEAKRKLVKSYEVMLDFYGIRLRNKDTGEVERSSRWKERFDNLNRNTHNNLRITRILKCLGTLGLEHYQAPLVKFFLTETLRNNQLHRVKQSVLDYFIFAVLNKSERKKLVVYAYENFRPKEDFVWGPRKILENGKAKAKVEKEKVNCHEMRKEQSRREITPPFQVGKQSQQFAANGYDKPFYMAGGQPKAQLRKPKKQKARKIKFCMW